MIEYILIYTPEFGDWLEQQTKKQKTQILDRLDRIEKEAHFGQHKSVSKTSEVWELKWKCGRRIYYAYFPEKQILLLLGGNKNGQNKDIAKAKKLFNNYTRKEFES